MCGIVGKLNFGSVPVEKKLIQRMCDLSKHRGPDEEGIYLDGTVGLGIRRLSIIDVPGGHQPLSNEDDSIWIVFNGEIYNFLELRTELERKGHRFRTNSDTEVIIHLYEEVGAKCVVHLNGMFAFALWDVRRQRLVLARDRLGKKPLHYAMTRDSLIFASEIPPLLEDPTLERQVNLLALHQYLRLWYVPSPLTMFEGIMKLLPAHTLVCEEGKARIERYWDIDFSYKLSLSEAEWSERILGLLRDAVRVRLRSDVPLGALLSGGIDSSAVVALMRQFRDQPVKTFSIGFEEEGYDELPYARRVADHLGTDHHEEIVRPDRAAILPKLIWHYGEPFGDDSCIPTYYLSRLARQHVTVALSGDGGDENFGGYPRVARHLAFSPFHSLRGLVAGEVKSILAEENPLKAMLPPARWNDFWREWKFRVNEIADPLERYAHAWVVWKDGSSQPLAEQSRVVAKTALAPFEKVWKKSRGWDPIDRLLYLDLMTYLPDDLQVKMDIASMAVSLEVRSPFLDYRLVELTAAMPSTLKIHSGQTKMLLRQVVRPLVAPGIVDRGKQGFSPPIDRWLASDLKPMVMDLLLDGTAQKRGFFRPHVVGHIVTQHMEKKNNYGRHIWLLLNFELWCRTFLD